jgi:hypothetical protein
MGPTTLPSEIVDVVGSFLTAEMSTFARDGTPITWPVLTSLEPKSGRLVVATSIGLPQKALNLRRNPKVGLLYSDPTGSGLADPPQVSILGEAYVYDRVFASLSEIPDRAIAEVFANDAIDLLRRQPSVAMYTRNPLARYLMDWYFLRLLIVVEPRRISWGHGDPSTWETIHVA